VLVVAVPEGDAVIVLGWRLRIPIIQD